MGLRCLADKAVRRSERRELSSSHQVFHMRARRRSPVGCLVGCLVELAEFGVGLGELLRG